MLATYDTMENDLLGYLVVLNDTTTLSYLTDAEKGRGRRALVGCLVRLTDQLEPISQIDSQILLQMIKIREAINVDPRSQIELKDLLGKSTEFCASAVFEYYKKYFRGG